jgi:hypothetical protein
VLHELLVLQGWLFLEHLVERSPSDELTSGFGPVALVLQVHPAVGDGEHFVQACVEGGGNELTLDVDANRGGWKRDHMGGGFLHFMAHLSGRVIGVDVVKFWEGEIFLFLLVVLVPFDVVAGELEDFLGFFDDLQDDV